MRDFKYLDKLIHSGAKEIVLNSDIIFDDNHVYRALEGIEINEDIEIDGKGHVIDAKGQTSIFNIVSGNITLKNIIFKNAYSKLDGGAIKHDEGKLDIINCQFINNFSQTYGSAIFCSRKTKLRIFSSRFIHNNTTEFGTIYNFNGNAEIHDSEFANNEGVCIFNQKRGRLLIENSEFTDNHAKNGAGIVNLGKCDISETLFENNIADEHGGAIHNDIRCILNITNSRFINNNSKFNGGAIINFSKIDIFNAVFFKNSSKENLGGAITNQENSQISIIDSAFIENSSIKMGGAIMNWGRVIARNVNFKNNTSIEFGGAIFNHENSISDIDEGNFTDNSSNSGGAIFNWAKLNLKNTTFKNNTSKAGGAINCSKKASTLLFKSEFLENSSIKGGSIFGNSANTKILRCKFNGHLDNDVIYNLKSISLTDCDFCKNNSKRIIFNDEDAVIDIIGGKFEDNTLGLSAIHNVGRQCILDNCLFNTNKSAIKYADICNETHLIMSNLKLKSDGKSILNKGTLDIKHMPPSKIRKSIENLDTINDFSRKSENEFDFSSLDELIKSKSNLKLNHDFILENYESDFYEGGIEINKDNLLINGCGHTIDGQNRTRIFIINAKDVVLKNIVFKNGSFLGNFDRFLSGGGAIHVLKRGSVKFEDCTFISNQSNSNGGAILNNGNVKSINSKFIENKSESFGGAIHNKQNLKTSNDDFKSNHSRIGGAIYNNGKLNIENIYQKDNKSQFQKCIYNAGIIDMENPELAEDLILNSSNIKLSNNSTKSFEYLLSEIEKSDEVKLDKDIVFNYSTDHLLKRLLDIKKNLVIDGCGHSIEYNILNDSGHVIDCSGSSSLFRIRKDDIKVILKNIIFKNCYSNGRDVIENYGTLIIENCRFIDSILTEDHAFINNKNALTIVDSHFSDNVSSRQSLLANSSKLTILNSNFINNISKALGSCISNDGEIRMENSIFKSNNTDNKAGCIYNNHKAKLKLAGVEFRYNDADIDGGAIYNYGQADIGNSKFINNMAYDEGGAINNRTGGEIRIKDSEFVGNESKTNGGAIFSHGKADIFQCEFIGNISKAGADAIEHARPLDANATTYLKVSNSKIISDNHRDDNAIHGYDGGNLKLENCKIENRQEHGYYR